MVQGRGSCLQHLASGKYLSVEPRADGATLATLLNEELGDEGWRTFAARAERTSPVLVSTALEKESVFSDHP